MWVRRTYLDARCRAILASFVFCPAGPAGPTNYGRRGHAIASTCPRIFEVLFLTKRHTNPLRRAQHITSLCHSLVRQGYLTQGKRVAAIHNYGVTPINSGVNTKQYDAPTFHLSDSGYAYVLSTFDQEQLPILFPGRPQSLGGSRAAKIDHGYNPLNPAIEKAFRAYAQLDGTRREFVIF